MVQCRHLYTKVKADSVVHVRKVVTTQMPVYWQLREAVCCFHAVEFFFHDKIAL